MINNEGKLKAKFLLHILNQVPMIQTKEHYDVVQTGTVSCGCAASVSKRAISYDHTATHKTR